MQDTGIGSCPAAEGFALKCFKLPFLCWLCIFWDELSDFHGCEALSPLVFLSPLNQTWMLFVPPSFSPLLLPTPHHFPYFQPNFLF